MDSSKDPFSDPHHSKKSEQSTPVKRPRQKRLQFDLVALQQRGGNASTVTGESSELTHQIMSNAPMPPPPVTTNYEDLSFQTGHVPHWFNDNGPYPRRDTPVPEPDGVIQSEDELWEEIQSLLEVPAPEELRPGTVDPPMGTGLGPWTNKRPQRQPQMFQRVDQLPPGMPAMNYPFMNEGMSERGGGGISASVPGGASFASSRVERARFMELMNPQTPPPVFEPTPPPQQLDLFPLETVGVFRRNLPSSPQMQNHIKKEEQEAGLYEEFPAFAQREWNVDGAGGEGANNKGPASQIMMDNRLRQSRRSRMQGGLRQEPPMNTFATRQNSLFDIGYPDTNAERSSRRFPSFREQLSRLGRRQSPLEETREQEIRATMERHRARQVLRERRSPCRGNDFGALMSALGLVPDEELGSHPHEGTSRISRVREAMVGIMNSRLPPHLLFSDRDFDGNDYEILSRLDDSVESKKGADDKIINKIDLCSFTPEGNALAFASPMESRCPICLENFTSGAELRVMPCRHKYHRCCLDKWLKINAVCPICNMNIKDKFHEENHEQN
eukprot:g1953.t1